MRSSWAARRAQSGSRAAAAGPCAPRSASDAVPSRRTIRSQTIQSLVARPHNAVAELTEFVLNAPGALGRRAFGSRFVRSHPELASSVPAPQAIPIVGRLREELPGLRIQTYRADPERF